MKIQERSVPPGFRAPGSALFRIAACLACSLFQIAVMAQPLPEWSCFRGPDRTNKSGETGLLSEWPEEGPELIWTISGLGKGYSNVSLADGYIFTSGSDEQQTFVFAFGLDGQLIWKKPNGIPWETELLDNHHGRVILHEGNLYGAGHNARGWFCLDFKTGKQKWSSGGKGSLTYAENMLYCLDERGIMMLVRATAERYESLSIFEVPEGGGGMHWAHPVVCGGRLYIRHQDKLFAYDISLR